VTRSGMSAGPRSPAPWSLPPEPSRVGGQALAVAPSGRSVPALHDWARSWILISKPASICRWMTISAAAGGSGIGTGQSSLWNRSARTCCGGELAHVDRLSPCQAA
jgi:hypothetical protein